MEVFNRGMTLSIQCIKKFTLILCGEKGVRE